VEPTARRAWAIDFAGFRLDSAGASQEWKEREVNTCRRQKPEARTRLSRP